MYFLNPVPGRGADIDQKDYGERLLDRLEVVDLLLNPILEDLKILLLQSGDKSAVAIEHRHGHRNQIRLYLYDLILVGCRWCPGWRRCLVTRLTTA